MNARPGPAERGSALVLAMMLIVVLSALAHSAVVGARATTSATLLARGRAEALAAADGGIALARLRLADGLGWAGGVETIGRCQVEVTASRAADGTFDVVATADCPVRGAGQPVRATIAAVLVPRADGLPRVVDWREPGGTPEAVHARPR